MPEWIQWVQWVFANFGDIVFVGVLVVVTALTYGATRAGTLPKGALWLVVGAAAALIGRRILTGVIADRLAKEAKEIQGRIDRRNIEIDRLEAKHAEAAAAARESLGALDRHVDNLRKGALIRAEKDRAVRERIATEPFEERARRFAELMGSGGGR